MFLPAIHHRSRSPTAGAVLLPRIVTPATCACWGQEGQTWSTSSRSSFSRRS